jgi:hypothetical protein
VRPDPLRDQPWGQRARAVAAAARDDDVTADGRDGGVGDRLREPAGKADPSRLRVDRDDPRRGRVGLCRAAADDEHAIAERRGGGMRGWLREVAQSPHFVRGGIERVDATVRRSVRQRSARDDHAPTRRGDGGVSHWVGQARDDACSLAGPPGDDRVQPGAAGVAADDVRLAAERGGRLIAAWGGQRADPCDRAACGVDPQDLVELADAVAASELVDEPADRDCGAVVEDGGDAADRALAASGNRADLGRRNVGGIQPAQKQELVPDGSDGRVLERRRERARGPGADA